MESNSRNTRRLFFALWPDNRTRKGIVERRELLGRVSRRQVPDHNLHLTLLFLGDQPAGRAAEFKARASTVRAQGCELVLDRFGWFARAGVVWLGGEAPDPLRNLVAELKAAMSLLGLDFDDRPFRPHVTLFRKVRRRPRFPEIEPLEWPVREFALIESVAGQPYRVLRTWPMSD